MASRYVGNNVSKEAQMPGRRGTTKSFKTKGGKMANKGKNKPGAGGKYKHHGPHTHPKVGGPGK